MKHSIHFGSNSYSLDTYGENLTLVGCCNDARDLGAAFASLGYESEVFLSGWQPDALPGVPITPGHWQEYKQCTLAAFKGAYRGLQILSKSGDTCVITNSGHGTQYSGWEGFGGGEGACFYDGVFKDTDLAEMRGGWKSGVNVIEIWDVCFAGGLDRFASCVNRPRFWADAGKTVKAGARTALPFVGNGLLFSACAVNEVSWDGSYHGAWTGALIDTIRSGVFTWGDWFQLAADKTTSLYSGQHPQLKVLGGGESLKGQTP